MVFLSYESVVEFPVFSPFFFSEILKFITSSRSCGNVGKPFFWLFQAAVENCLSVFHGRGISIASPFSPAAFARGHFGRRPRPVFCTEATGVVARGCKIRGIGPGSPPLARRRRILSDTPLRTLPSATDVRRKCYQNICPGRPCLSRHHLPAAPPTILRT